MEKPRGKFALAMRFVLLAQAIAAFCGGPIMLINARSENGWYYLGAFFVFSFLFTVLIKVFFRIADDGRFSDQ